MALFVLCDPTFRYSAWCERKLKGIRDEVARRRTSVKVFTNIDAFEAAATKLGTDSSVILLFSKISYIQSVSKTIQKLHVHPILTNPYIDIKLPFTYSRATTDHEENMRSVIEYLYSCGKKKIALLGVDGNSWGDVGMAQVFTEFAPHLADNIYYAKGDMESCFCDYLRIVDKVDAVLFPNDHLAICFIEFLKERNAYNDALFVIGRGDSISAKLYDNGITSITTDFYECGRAAAELHFNRLRYGWEYADIKLKSQLMIRGSTKNIPFSTPSEPVVKKEILPDVKPTLFRIPTNHVGNVDRLLIECDLTDLKLIYCMMLGYSYERIGEFCFLSIEAVKYRVRKIRKRLEGERKADAIEILSKYINKNRLLSTIEELEKKFLQ